MPLHDLINYTMHELNKLTGEIVSHKLSISKENHEAYLMDISDAGYSEVSDCNLGNVPEFFSTALSKSSNISTKRHDSYLHSSANKDGTAGKAIC